MSDREEVAGVERVSRFRFGEAPFNFFCGDADVDRLGEREGSVAGEGEEDICFGGVEEGRGSELEGRSITEGEAEEREGEGEGQGEGAERKGGDGDGGGYESEDGAFWRAVSASREQNTKQTHSVSTP